MEIGGTVKTVPYRGIWKSWDGEPISYGVCIEVDGSWQAMTRR